MTSVTLVTVSPRNPSSGATTTLRFAGGGNSKPYFYSSTHYRAGVAGGLRINTSIGFDENGPTGGVVPQTGVITIAPASKTDLATWAGYFWPNADITVQEGDELTAVFSTRLTGKVADATVQDHKLVITLADPATGLDRPVVTARFLGTGGVEGGTEAKNRIKRRTWGRAFNLEGRVLDKANNIYEFGDLSFPWQEISVVRDKGRDATPAPTVVAWAGSVAATLTALAAQSMTGIQCAVAPSIACVKWYTQPAGPLTADVKGEVGTGYVETVPEIAARILSAVSGPSITNTAAMASLRSGPAGIHIDEGENINSALNRLLMPSFLLWILNAGAGTITLREISFTSPVEAITADNAERERTFAPTKTRRVGYQRAYRQHSDGEIAASLDVQVISLTSTAEAFTFVDGVAAPAAQSITFTANAVDPSETVNWTTSPAVTLTGTGNTRALSLANFAANTQVVVTATGAASGAKDDKTIVRLNQSTAAAGAGTTLTLIPLHANLIVTGNGIAQSIDGTWNTFHSKESYYRSAQCSWKTTTVNKLFVVGLINAIPATSGDPDGFDNIGWSLLGNSGTLYYYEPVADTFISAGTYVAGDSFAVATDNLVAKFYKITAAGVRTQVGPVAGVAVPADQTWRFGGQLNGGSITEVVFSPGPDNNFASQGGATVPEPSAEVQADITGKDVIWIKTNSGGTPLTGQLTRSETYALREQGAVVASGVTWSITNSPAGITASFSGAGQLDISAFSADEAELRIKATRTGREDRFYTVTVRRDKAAPPTTGGGGGGTGGSTASATVSTSLSSTSAVVLSPSDLVIDLGSVGSVALVASLEAAPDNVAPNGFWTISIRFQRWNGSAWVDVGTGYQTAQSQRVNDPDVGSHLVYSAYPTINDTYSGTPGATGEKFRLVGFLDAARTHSVGGSISVTGS
jgi:hypothetical protein